MSTVTPLSQLLVSCVLPRLCARQQAAPSSNKSWPTLNHTQIKHRLTVPLIRHILRLVSIHGCSREATYPKDPVSTPSVFKPFHVFVQGRTVSHGNGLHQFQRMGVQKPRLWRAERAHLWLRDSRSRPLLPFPGDYRPSHCLDLGERVFPCLDKH